MDTEFFSWTARRVDLRNATTPAPPSHRNGLDVDIAVGPHQSRLLASAATESDDAEWVALVIGHTDDADNVPVRVVDEETLLLDGGRCVNPPEILVSGHSHATVGRGGSALRRIANSQLCTGGIPRDLLTSSGARSVAFEWCDADRAQGTSAPTIFATP